MTPSTDTALASAATTASVPSFTRALYGFLGTTAATTALIVLLGSVV